MQVPLATSLTYSLSSHKRPLKHAQITRSLAEFIELCVESRWQSVGCFDANLTHSVQLTRAKCVLSEDVKLAVARSERESATGMRTPEAWRNLKACAERFSQVAQADECVLV